MSMQADLLLTQAHDHQRYLIDEAQRRRLLRSARRARRPRGGRHTARARSVGTVVPCRGADVV